MFRAPCRESGGLNCSAVIAPEMQVTPVPYMTERAPPGLTSIQMDNTPYSLREQQDIIRDVYGSNFSMNNSYAQTWPRFGQQFEKFKAFLTMMVLPVVNDNVPYDIPSVVDFRKALEAQVPASMRPEDHGKAPIKVEWVGGSYYADNQTFSKAEYDARDVPEVVIAIVGHNQMMSEYCLGPDFLPKPRNNAILEKLMIVRASEGKVSVQEMAGKCPIVMDAPDKSAWWDSFATADVACCRNPYDVADFMNLKTEPVLEKTKCVNSAPESAFPIVRDSLVFV